MKPYHVLIGAMLVLTLLVVHKCRDDRRIEAVYKERSIALNIKPPTEREICLMQVKDERICK